MKSTRYTCLAIVTLLTALLATPTSRAADDLVINRGARISIIGNTLADRMQHHGWLETNLHALFPAYEITLRNLGFPGDQLTSRQRSDNFGNADQWLTKIEG